MTKTRNDMMTIKWEPIKFAINCFVVKCRTTRLIPRDSLWLSREKNWARVCDLLPKNLPYKTQIYNFSHPIWESVREATNYICTSCNKDCHSKIGLSSHSRACRHWCADHHLSETRMPSFMTFLITTTGGTEEAVEARCRKAQAFFFQF